MSVSISSSLTRSFSRSFSQSFSVSAAVLLSSLVLSACDPVGKCGSGFEQVEARTSGRSVEAVLAGDAASTAWPVWIEEQLAPWPETADDRDPGLRQLVRRAADGGRQVVYAPSHPDRLTAAVSHGGSDGAWSAVGFDGELRPFLVRGDQGGVKARLVVDDPELAADENAWVGTHPPDKLRVGALSQDSVRIAGSGDEVVVSLMSDHHAVLVYRYRWDGAAYQKIARTLAVQAQVLAPFLPIGATYDNFDAVVNPYSPRLAVGADGDAYVALSYTTGQLMRFNAVFGTDLKPLQTGPSLDKPGDVLVTRIGRDGKRVWARVAGSPDVDDEVYGLAVGPAGRVAVVGRTRREPGRDNTELHALVTVLDGSGATVSTLVRDVADSGLAQAAVFSPSGALWVGGTEGYVQNPSGISLLQPGRPFLLRLDPGPNAAQPVVSVETPRLPETAGHAELRSLSIAGGRLWLSGLERGPLTHTGDGDRSLIRADGYLAALPL